MITDSAMISQEGKDGPGCIMSAFTSQLYSVGLEVADLLSSHE